MTDRINFLYLSLTGPILALILIIFSVNAHTNELLLKKQSPNQNNLELQRFFLMGDGQLWLQGEKILFRDSQGNYLDQGLRRIHQIFKAPWSPKEERLSLRFIEVLDYMQDQLGGGNYRLRSGYRSPKLNQGLRNRGKLAAQSSMHVEAAAGDLILSGIPSGKVFEFIKELNCCGIGWYHSKHFHLDTGPPRYWDEKTSKTEDKTPQQNSKIILQALWDRYKPGERMALQFMRATHYPYGIPTYFELVSQDSQNKEQKSKTTRLDIEFPATISYLYDPNKPTCVTLANRSQARQLGVGLPKKIKPGKYAIQVSFCDQMNYERMPKTILSRPFEIVGE